MDSMELHRLTSMKYTRTLFAISSLLLFALPSTASQNADQPKLRSDAIHLNIGLHGWANTTPMAVFVSPDAPEGGDGSREHPYATIESARDALRLGKKKATHGIITLLPGDYIINNTIHFGPEDHGLILRGDSSEKVRLLGSIKIKRPELLAIKDPVIRAILPPIARPHVRVVSLPSGKELFGPVHRGMGLPMRAIGSEVFCNGIALTRARWPNLEFTTIAKVLDPGSIPRNRADDIPLEDRETGPERGGSFSPADASRLAAWARASARAQTLGAGAGPWANGYWHWDWAEEQLPIAAIDVENSSIQLGLPHRYGLREKAEFYVTNLLEELDTPGEYYIDMQAGLLYLWPTVDDVEELLLTTLGGPMMEFEGTQEVHISGLTFFATRGAAIVARNVTHWVLDEVMISHTGTQGLILSGSDNVVRNCRFEGSGGTSVEVTGGDKPTLTHGRNQVTRNHFMNFGRIYRTYQPAVKIAGVGQVVAHNEMHNAPHTAILFSGNDHQIVANEIYDVLRETGDCGAIYCGRDWTMHGNVIDGNFIHDLPGADGRWQNAIYLDDMASGIKVSNNLIFRCHWGMLIGGGRDVMIEDNVFVSCEMGLSFDSRGTGWMASSILDPKTSTILRSWSALALDAPPWSERFPTLQAYRSDRLGKPVGSSVVRNRFFATPFGKLADPESVTVQDNTLLKTVPHWVQVDKAARAGVRLDVGAEAWQNVGLRQH